MTNLGHDLSCVDDLTDLMIEVEGLRGLAEAIARRLITPRGRLLGDPNYGLDVRRFLHKAMTDAERASIPGQVRAEVLKEERVEDCIVEVRTLTHDTIELALRVTVGEGPFELTLGVGAARALIANATINGELLKLAGFEEEDI